MRLRVCTVYSRGKQLVAFNALLTLFISNLTLLLLASVRWEDALTAIEEAVVLYRTIVVRRPAGLNAEFAL